MKHFRLINNYGLVLFGNGVAGVLSFLISVLLSRSMSMGGFGSFSLFFTILGLVWQVPGFIDSSYVRYARAAPPSGAREYLRVNLAFKIRAWAWILMISPGAAFVFSRWVFPGKATFGILVMAFAGGAFLTFLASIIADFQARQRYAGYAFGNIFFYAVTLAVLFLLSRGGRILAPSTPGLVFLATAAAAGTAAWAWLARRVWPLFPLNPESAARMRSLGRWILYTGLLSIVLQRIDMLIVGHFFSRVDLGVYAAASRLLSALTLFLSAAAAIYLPNAALAVGSASTWRRYWREAAVLTILILLVSAGLMAAAPRLVSLFFGAPYAGAAVAVRALVLGHVPLVLALPMAYLLYGLEDSFSNFAGMALCLGANIAVNTVLTPRLGVTGPGWAFGAGYSVYLLYVFGAFFLRRSHRAWIAGLD